MMPVIVGAVLAIAVGLMATMVGLDRDRAFYSVVTIVVASYYALFAVMGGSATALVFECAAGLLFLVAALVGFRSSLWIVAVALVGHGVFDLVHDRMIVNTGVPPWWPAFCMAYDVTAGAYLAYLLTTRMRSSRAVSTSRWRSG